MYGGNQRGQRLVAFDHLEERLLLAEEVLLGPGDDRDAQVAEQPGLFHLGHRAQHPLAFALEARLERDEHFARVDGERGDRQSLDDLVRIRTQDGPVLERARLALRAVAHGIAVPTGRGAHGPPLRRRREPGATPPPQAGVRQPADRLIRAERPGLLQTPSAIRREIVVEGADGISGQDHADVTHRSHLR